MARIAERSTGHWLTPSRAAEHELSPRTIDGLVVAATSAADEAGLRAALRAALAEGRRHWEAIGAPLPAALFDELSAALNGGER
jgi:lincosamide nucleotidyltransferase